ncbi:MAG: anti-sigma regulatory factor [Gemmatimonadetes bacterium]|nr:MAG: anti-sigma regulatory factor [Gemmatimonadota bacterium]
MDDLIIEINADADVMIAQIRARKFASALGFSKPEATAVAIVVSELSQNIVTYGHGGQITISSLHTSGVGLQIVATDHGPGIHNIEQALKDGFTTGKSLGIGLPAVKRLMDEFEIKTGLDQGTTITVKKWIKTT